MKKKRHSTKFIDLTGNRYGKLIVIGKSSNKNTKITWECVCDCGNKVIVTGQDLKRGHTKSCGCLLKNNTYQFMDNYVIGYTNKGEEFYFDLEDYAIVSNYTWLIKRGYVESTDADHKVISLHRIVTNVKDGEMIDHINHDTKDNRKNNLRICNSSKNQMNKKLQINNKSGKTGVFWDKQRNAWKSQISVNKERINLGWYDVFEDAVKIRIEAEEKYFKEFKYNIEEDIRMKGN